MFLIITLQWQHKVSNLGFLTLFKEYDKYDLYGRNMSIRQ